MSTLKFYKPMRCFPLFPIQKRSAKAPPVGHFPVSSRTGGVSVGISSLARALGRALGRNPWAL